MTGLFYTLAPYKSEIKNPNSEINQGVACGPGFTLQILAPAIAPRKPARGLWVLRCNPNAAGTQGGEKYIRYETVYQQLLPLLS
ncbi:hypothetical protein LX99_04067 [Mucilaginibacter oryzae]|uniref:Uncharacterized protein n=1 Tax=Mucilaginibacter oryzae TaxID=468058 RepID=A0A316HJZ0_9SPHI|nr:hypothetical protein [Mucilaginibacter oryzae]PWK74265.1 hypothetical protein LX99_04067 [Mucilaginibacter oryzae]